MDRAYCGTSGHASFRLCLFYMKVLLYRMNCYWILDICGQKRSSETLGCVKSMFKGLDWIKDNGMMLANDGDTVRRYRHILYMPNVRKGEPETYAGLKY